MEIDDRIDWYLDHLEDISPSLVDVEEPKAREVAPSIAEEYGFVRRYLDGLEDVDEDYPIDLYARPDEASDRLQSIEQHFRNAGLRDVLPSPAELVSSMRRISDEALRLQIGEGIGPTDPEAHPNPTLERAEPARQLRDDADQLLSIARTLETLGAAIPATLFGQSIQLGEQLHRALDPEPLDFFLGESRDECVERLLGVESFGKFLWNSLTRPESRSRLVRQLEDIEPAEALDQQEDEESAPLDVESAEVDIATPNIADAFDELDPNQRRALRQRPGELGETADLVVETDSLPSGRKLDWEGPDDTWTAYMTFPEGETDPETTVGLTLHGAPSAQALELVGLRRELTEDVTREELPEELIRVEFRLDELREAWDYDGPTLAIEFEDGTVEFGELVEH